MAAPRSGTLRLLSAGAVVITLTAAPLAMAPTARAEVGNDSLTAAQQATVTRLGVDASVSTDPAQLAADASPTGGLAVARVDASGRLQVDRVAVTSTASAAAIQSQPGVVAVSPVTTVHAIGGLSPVTLRGSAHAAATYTDDPGTRLQWWLGSTQAPAVWPAAGGGSGEVVAVVDSGVDGTHADLAGQVLAGKDLVTPTNPDGWSDGAGHGTFVAGLIAAIANNGIGISGLAPKAEILPVRVLDDDGSGTDTTVAAGIVWAADNGATVINLSLGGSGRSAVMAKAVAYALGKGIPVVAANGNDRTDGDAITYPAHEPGVIAVGAATENGAPADFSNNRNVDLLAPGVDMVSTDSNFSSGYAEGDGTSFASPLVAASVALARAVDPTATPRELRALVLTRARNLGPAGYDTATGYGALWTKNLFCGASLCPVGLLTGSVTGSAPAVVFGRSSTVRFVATESTGDAMPKTTLTVAAAGWPTRTFAVPGNGVVSIRLRLTRSTTFVLHTTSAGYTNAARAFVASIIPHVRVHRSGPHGRKVTVVALPAAHQAVTVRYRVAGHWRTTTVHLDGAGRAVVRVPGSVRTKVRVVVAGTSAATRWSSRTLR